MLYLLLKVLFVHSMINRYHIKLLLALDWLCFLMCLYLLLADHESLFDHLLEKDP